MLCIPGSEAAPQPITFHAVWGRCLFLENRPGKSRQPKSYPAGEWASPLKAHRLKRVDRPLPRETEVFSEACLVLRPCVEGQWSAHVSSFTTLPFLTNPSCWQVGQLSAMILDRIFQWWRGLDLHMEYSFALEDLFNFNMRA